LINPQVRTRVGSESQSDSGQRAGDADPIQSHRAAHLIDRQCTPLPVAPEMVKPPTVTTPAEMESIPWATPLETRTVWRAPAPRMVRLVVMGSGA